ncbi:hypothetical protein CDL15_Pgr003487 [Punica granatum]|uniref:Uncharacterized protein n=1 Tax=Punica granatum TaxID=22663 RepID=A0A218X331_PUNGR|nr:hypothetical protein CDL15_Pgr003487 [Punica granatum]
MFLWNRGLEVLGESRDLDDEVYVKSPPPSSVAMSCFLQKAEAASSELRLLLRVNVALDGSNCMTSSGDRVAGGGAARRREMEGVLDRGRERVGMKEEEQKRNKVLGSNLKVQKYGPFF